jgi:hypothetical protein
MFRRSKKTIITCLRLSFACLLAFDVWLCVVALYGSAACRKRACGTRHEAHKVLITGGVILCRMHKNIDTAKNEEERERPQRAHERQRNHTQLFKSA